MRRALGFCYTGGISQNYHCKAAGVISHLVRALCSHVQCRFNTLSQHTEVPGAKFKYPLAKKTESYFMQSDGEVHLLGEGEALYCAPYPEGKLNLNLLN